MARRLVWLSTLAMAASALVAGAASAQYRGYGDGYAAAPDYYGRGGYDDPYGGAQGDPYGGPQGPYGGPRPYRGGRDADLDAPRRAGRPRDARDFDERDYGYGYDQGPPPPYAEPYDGGRAPGQRAGDYELQGGSQQSTRTEVANPTKQPPGTIVINTAERHLYYTQADGRAIQYGIGVGRQGFTWKGTAAVKRKAEWPDWIPPSDMLKRRPDLPTRMEGGIENPLGARALYLFQGAKDTMFRIHGTNEPETIGKAVSSGCIRMMNADVIDLYRRVPVGTKVVVL